MNARFTQPTFTNGQVVENWNLTQLQPHTAIGEGVTGLTFRNCNLLNCDVPADAVIEGSLHCHKSFCSHLHPAWIPHGLPKCVEVCEHVADIDEVTIDGETVLFYTYADEVVS